MALTKPQRDYALGFLRSLDRDPSALGDGELRLVFDLLSRREEWECPVRHENHNWEPSLAPVARREGSFAPLLEQQVEAWGREGRLPRVTGTAARWPNGKAFALCLTHDIDILQEYLWLERWRHLPSLRRAPARQRAVMIGSLVAQAAKRVAHVGRKRASPPLDAWLEAENRHGFRSTCHFFADPLPHATWEDKFYRYRDRIEYEGRSRTIGEVIRAVAQAGWDAGVHGSLPSHRDDSLLSLEKDAVEAAAGQPVVSTRQHHLAWDVRVTPGVHAAAGLRVDSSLGSNIDLGFRCGTGMPFFVYDLAADRPLDLLQIPLVIQDNPLQRLSAGNEDLMTARCVELIDRVAAVGGAITLLWHNQHRPGSVAFRCYERVLAAAAERGAWGCSMRQLDEWWRGRLAPRSS